MPDARYSGTDNLEMMKEAVNYNRWLVQLVRDRARKGNRLLDFGAGVGTLALELAGDGYRVECVEPDASQRETLSAARLPAHADLTSIDDESVDFAYTFNVLEHIDDDRGALRQLARTIRRGGSLLVYVPAFPILYTSMDRKVGHLRRYRKRELEEKVREAGLTVREAGYVDSLGFFATLAYRAFGSDTGDIDPAALRTYDRWIFPASRLLDVAARHVLGKNVLLVANRPP
jgi:SAM-dependent methyltransferase